MEHLTGTRIRRDGAPATVNLRRCKLVVIKGAQRGTELVISGDVFRVGKAPENDLVLSDDAPSYLLRRDRLVSLQAEYPS